MPYKIASQCSGTETICEDVCAYDCIQPANAAAADEGPHFQIDAQLCTDCGACALACPEGAFVGRCSIGRLDTVIGTYILTDGLCTRALRCAQESVTSEVAARCKVPHAPESRCRHAG